MTTAYIALGSNLGDSRALLGSALANLDELPQSSLTAHSPTYRNAAIGPGRQPDYLNMVAELETTLSPPALLQALQAIEAAHGRERGERWAARYLDLDLLLYGSESIDTPELTVPHPRMAERNFVLYPLFDLAPGMALPCGKTLESLLDECPRDGLEPLGVDIEPGR
jgi:2-amino-4-hydroxy-6-hydroxymethyldihydropteridine diphosphokinase